MWNVFSFRQTLPSKAVERALRAIVCLCVLKTSSGVEGGRELAKLAT